MALHDSTLNGAHPPFPERLASIPGDIVVVLSEAEFISFSWHWPIGKGLVAIRTVRTYPMTLPNVARNVIAHELGHAIGLAHNSDPTMLMCGRPAPCRPIAFQSRLGGRARCRFQSDVDRRRPGSRVARNASAGRDAGGDLPGRG